MALLALKAVAAAVAVGTGLVSAFAWLDAKRKTAKPVLVYAQNEVRSGLCEPRLGADMAYPDHTWQPRSLL